MNNDFRGRFDGKVDEKGRFTFPNAWRSTTSQKKDFWITNGFYLGFPCVDVYPNTQWKSLIKRIDKLPQFDRNVQTFQRYYLASGVAVDCDKQNRLLLPTHHREHAKIEKEVVILGMGNKFELWAPKNWAKIQEQMKTDFEDVMIGLTNLERENDE